MASRFFTYLVIVIFAAQQNVMPAVADDTQIVVAGTIIPGVFDESGRLPYSRIFFEASKGYLGPVRLSMMPARRAKRAFFNHMSDCLYLGMDDPEMYLAGGVPEDQLLMSDPVNTINLRVYTRREEQPIWDINELAGQNIVLDTNADIPESLRSKLEETAANIIPGLSVDHAVALLQQGRAKAAILFDFSLVLRDMRNPELKLYKPKPGAFLLSDGDTIVCWRDRKTEAFITHVDARLALLYASGWHDRVFKGQ